MLAKLTLYVLATAIVAFYAYRRGFRAGAVRTRRIWKAILERSMPAVESTACDKETSTPAELARGHRTVLAENTIRGAFGNN